MALDIVFFHNRAVLWQMRQTRLPSLSLYVFVTDFLFLWCHILVKFSHGCVLLMSVVWAVHLFTVYTLQLPTQKDIDWLTSYQFLAVYLIAHGMQWTCLASTGHFCTRSEQASFVYFFVLLHLPSSVTQHMHFILHSQTKSKMQEWEAVVYLYCVGSTADLK